MSPFVMTMFKQSIKPVRNTYNSFIECQLSLTDYIFRKNFAFTKTSMTQTRENWNSHVLSRPDFWMVFEWYGDIMVFCVFIFIYFFCLEPTLRKDTWKRATSATVMVIFRKCYSESYLITAMLKFLLNNYEAHWKQSFKGHPTVEDFMDMD